MDSVEDLLKSIDLEEFVDLFRYEGITLDILLDMGHEDLKSLDIRAGHRMMILKAINTFKSERATELDDKRQPKPGAFKEPQLDNESDELEDKHNSEQLEDKHSAPQLGHKHDKLQLQHDNKEHQSEDHHEEPQSEDRLDEPKIEDEQVQMAQFPVPNAIRMVLLGKTGSGKSKTGNSILGKKSFIYGGETNSVTSTCEWKSTIRFGKILHVVDTPDVFDTARSNEEVQKEIKRCIAMTTPGPHAFLLCVKMTRFTDEDVDVFDHFMRCFGDDMLQFSLVIFTCKDQSEADKEENDDKFSEHEYIKNLPKGLQNFLDKIQNRYVFFNNRMTDKGKKDLQIKDLISLIERMMNENNRRCYTNCMTNEVYEEVERLLQKEIKETGRSRDEIKEDETFIPKVAVILQYIIKISKRVINHTVRKFKT